MKSTTLERSPKINFKRISSRKVELLEENDISTTVPPETEEMPLETSLVNVAQGGVGEKVALTGRFMEIVHHASRYG